MTPFSATSIERGLDGVLVSVARVLDAARADGLSPEKAAWRVEQEQGLLDAVIVDALAARSLSASDEDAADAVRLRLLNRLDQWRNRRTVVIAAEQDAGLRASRRRGQSGAADDQRRERQGRDGLRRDGRRSSWPTRCARCSRRSTCWSARSRRTCSLLEAPGTRQFVLPTDDGSDSMTATAEVSEASGGDGPSQPRARPARRRRSGRPRTGTKTQLRQGGVGAAVVAALHLRPGRDHGPAAVHHHAGRAGRLGTDLGAPGRHPPHPRAPAARRGAAHARPPGGASSGPSPGSRRPTRGPGRATTSACRPGCSRSGCAAPAATCSVR